MKMKNIKSINLIINSILSDNLLFYFLLWTRKSVIFDRW